MIRVEIRRKSVLPVAPFAVVFVEIFGGLLVLGPQEATTHIEYVLEALFTHFPELRRTYRKRDLKSRLIRWLKLLVKPFLWLFRAVGLLRGDDPKWLRPPSDPRLVWVTPGGHPDIAEWLVQRLVLSPNLDLIPVRLPDQTPEIPNTIAAAARLLQAKSASLAG